ncbi:PREDICTED: cation/H(+) antiporter 26 isoform X2 [Tarenaya hassleriana]|uniref:cation/H(+) antiporter 26 isoform X1 n=1 Tax=Tarenaya hassleriana TaxID=28532 RepID=UPI00053C0E73|nr:PREDICTED: cation/H(+) antiporter 26 isoform X1 [Tarenaya hassleriana]XP_010543176.1 PREDICTED: cation/H(+) antiporter 26 isoform X2 [Tarenaya hassleriana]
MLVANQTEIACMKWLGSTSGGVWRGQDPTKLSTPLLLLQVSLVSSVSALLQAVIRPLGQNFVAQMLAGIFLGPSVLGRSKRFSSNIFNKRGMFVIDNLETICFMFISYIMTVQVDLGMMKRGGRLAIINGFVLWALPIAVAYSSVFLFLKSTGISSVANMNPSQLYNLARTNGSLYFQVFYEVLSNLKMLNSEPGRLGLSSAMTTNGFGWIFFMLYLAYRRSFRPSVTKPPFWPTFSMLLLTLGIIVVCRPILEWIVKKTPEGQKLRPTHLCVIVTMLCIVTFLVDAVGLPFMFGPMLLGLVTPNKAPLGAGLTSKMDSFVSVLMPCYVIGIGQKIDFHAFGLKDFVILEMLFLLMLAAKFASIVVPSLFFRVPLSHATMLGLTVCIQGIYDVQLYKLSLNYRDITDEGFGMMVVAAMFHSTILTTILNNLYSSTHKLIAYRRRTVQHCQHNTPLRILACFAHHETVPSILSFLELSRPSRSSPLSIFTLNLEELEIDTVPQLIHHQVDPNPLTSSDHRDQIVNAFLNFFRKNKENVSLDCYTAIGPRKTMHEDVCALAFDKDADLVILALDLEADTSVPGLCSNVIQNSLCSVAILVDRGNLPHLRLAAMRHVRVNVCAIFLGGADDRETLALATRMASHRSVGLRVLRFVEQDNHIPLDDFIQRQLDVKAIDRFREQADDKENVIFSEVMVEDVTGLVDTLRKEGDEYDLIMVGIRHEGGFPLLKGLSMWSEMGELGEVADLLVSKDLSLTASVLAVQQQHMVVEGMLDHFSARHRL